MVDLPTIILSWNKLVSASKFSFSDEVDGVNLRLCKMQHITGKCSSLVNGRNVVVIGSPVENDTVDVQITAHNIANSADVENYIRSLNGEFLVIIFEAEQQTLKVYTDRFGSYPFYYAQDTQYFVGSYQYLDLVQIIKKWSGFKLMADKAYEFIVLQRLMGEKTHDNFSLILPPACVLEVSRNNEALKVRTYWERNYHKDNKSSKSDFENKFISLISKSVRVRLGNVNKQFGLFLSGGHDSRVVATYADKSLRCYTLGFKQNRESDCAKAIAEKTGHSHRFLKLDDEYFYKTLNQSVYLSGGMYALDHALFLPSDEQMDRPDADVYLHGHGLDFMFQGMYLHACSYKIFGRDTFVKHMLPFPDDISRHFIDKVSYRLKYDYRKIFKNTSSCDFYEKALYETVKKIENRARLSKLDDNAVWEYLTFHHHARHYTFTNVLSKRVCGEVRTPSFDNLLYDFYLALPDKYRLHADVLRAAMNRHSSRVGAIPAGNHGIPAGLGPYAKTLYLIGRKFLKEITGIKSFGSPCADDRTWPDRNDYLLAHPLYWQECKSILKDDEFKNFFEFVDWRQLEGTTENFLKQEHGGSLFVALLTYYKFYKVVYPD